MEPTSTPPSPEDDFDPDDYIRTAVTYGRLDVVKDWLPHHRDDPQRISQLVLFPAAMFGQLELLIFCLDYGDMNHREEHHPVYRGWNLTHFAVKGIHMNVHVPAEENQQNGQLCGEENVLRTKLEIHSRLLDILAVLLSRGVDPTVPDCEGNTASGKASSLSSREECFLDGAVLLDIHVCTHSLESGGSPKTPGLEALKKLPEDLQWQLALQPLLEWAYSRNRFDVLTFCHKNRFVDLTQKKMCLGQSGKPLMIDSLHTQRFSLLREMIQSSSDIDPCVCAQKLLTKMYECGPRKETLLSYATRAATSGNASLLPSLLSPETLGVHLSHIKIEGVNLETVPLSLFTPSLAHLELSKNQLSTLPVGDAIDRGLCDRLEELSIAGNAFSEFPGDIFRLPRLVRLDARNNVISSVPVSMWTAPRLEELYLSKNNVACLPCPDYVYLRPGVTASVQSRLMTFYHGFSSTETRHVQSARQSCVTLAAPGAESQGGGFRLKTLDLSDNQLTEIPPGLPCLAPRLRTLKLSGNRINHLGHPCNYPQMLEKLDMNKNASKSCIQWCGDPPSLVCAQSRLREGSEPCSHIGHKVLSNLKFLFLEENQLTSVELEEQQPIRHRNSIESVSDFGSMGDSGTHGGERDGGGEVLMTLMFPRLESLRLSNNQLERVPSGIHRVVELRELKLDGNTGITRLPSNIHLLQELFFFTFEGISDPVVSELRSCSNTPEQLLYLKAREKDYCRNTAMRLFVIGHFSKGKTSVIGALRKTKQLRTFDERAGRHLDPDYHLTEDERQSTVGIQCDRWVYKKAGATTQVTFYTWDFAGQEEYYLTHQCFFTNRALYLLVWSVTDGVEGIKSLTVWLQNLQAKAPGSSVIVVGTHMDLVPRTEREEKARVWLDMVNWYNSNRAHSHLYPHIMGTCFVGIPQKGKVSGVHGPDSLADFIYDVAMKMEVPNGPHVGGASVKMMQEMIPVAYETLRQEIERLQEDVWSKQVPPVMNRDTFWSRMSETVGLDNTAMEAAVDFLHASSQHTVVMHVKPCVQYIIVIVPYLLSTVYTLLTGGMQRCSLIFRTFGALFRMTYSITVCGSAHRKNLHSDSLYFRPVPLWWSDASVNKLVLPCLML
jgi:Leucine-rich repeat (LRR) protein